MSRILITIFLSIQFLIADDSQAGDEVSPEQVVELLLSGKTLTAAQQCSFAETEYTKPGEVKRQVSLVKLKGSEEEYKQASSVYNKLYGKKNEEPDAEATGLNIGWYLIMIGEKASTLPLVISVTPDSAASAAGLLPGDVIHNMGKFKMEGDNTRNQFVQFINNWPDSEPLTLKISRSKSRDPSSYAEKKIKKTLLLYGAKK